MSKSKEDPKSLTIWQQLAMPFYPSQLEWRVGQSGNKGGKNWAKLLCYKDARADMTRLDEVVGAANWSREHRCVETSSGTINICRVGIRIGQTDEWIYKEDGAEPTAVESVKGGLSDSFKRACVNFGIGRYLYDLGETMIFDNQIHKGYIPKGEHDAIRIQIKGDNSSFWANYPPMDARFLPANYVPIRQPSNDPPPEPPQNAPQSPPKSQQQTPAQTPPKPAASQPGVSSKPSSSPWRGCIAEVKVVGQGKSGKGPWSIKKIIGHDGAEFTTFSDTYADNARSMINAKYTDGRPVEIVIEWEEVTKGKYTNNEVNDLISAEKYDANVNPVAPIDGPGTQQKLADMPETMSPEEIPNQGMPNIDDNDIPF